MSAAIAVAGTVVCLAPAAAAHASRGVGDALREDLQEYLDAHRAQDRMTAVSLRVSYPDRRPAISAGVSADRPVPDDALWQIGSNTKNS
ncbi:hypothetical protein [Lentzea sp. NPDC060358]|uniref:hypothetical protein n=1 Tax=Lentzea sp. NPDC060358 TaxID=3347103 RepID=UPI0036530D4A